MSSLSKLNTTHHLNHKYPAHDYGMQGEQQVPQTPSVTHFKPSFPFLHVGTTLKGLSYKKVPDPEVNVLFEVGDTTLPEDKYLLEFVEDGIRIYKEDSANVSLFFVVPRLTLHHIQTTTWGNLWCIFSLINTNHFTLTLKELEIHRDRVAGES